MPEVIEKRLLNPDGSAKDRIVGFETEYGLSAKLKEVRPGARYSEWYREQANLMAAGVKDDTEESYEGEQQYGEDGDRQYVDVGPHPEVSTAEDIDFVMAAWRVPRGHVKMSKRYQNATSKVNEKLKHIEETPKNIVERVDLVANTCDPEGGASWASHQNSLTMRALEFRDFANALIVHHLSRPVWSGVGSPKRGSKEGSFRYVLSEKADHIWEEIGSGTTRDRPLVNTRDEPLANPAVYRRIHDVSGETTMNPFTDAMRLASGSIILRACELGVSFDDLMPTNPVRAMRDISQDTSLRHKVSVESERWFSGLDLQEALALRAITSALAAEYLTEQELEWGIKWIDLIDDLRKDPALCDRRVAWVKKKELIEAGIGKPRKNGATDFSVAWQMALYYHGLLPREGYGMKLMRSGYFENSPPEKFLDGGVPLPPTRAKLRGESLKVLTAARPRRQFSADWEHLKLNDQAGREVPLNDPYETKNEYLEMILEEVKHEFDDDESSIPA